MLPLLHLLPVYALQPTDTVLTFNGDTLVELGPVNPDSTARPRRISIRSARGTTHVDGPLDPFLPRVLDAGQSVLIAEGLTAWTWLDEALFERRPGARVQRTEAPAEMA